MGNDLDVSPRSCVEVNYYRRQDRPVTCSHDFVRSDCLLMSVQKIFTLSRQNPGYSVFNQNSFKIKIDSNWVIELCN